MAKDPKSNPAHLMETLHQGLASAKNLEAHLTAGQSSKGKHNWPKPGVRLNTGTQKNPPSTSGRKPHRRSPTALQHDDATPEWNSPVIDFAPPAPKRALLVTRGDNMGKSLQFIKEAMDMAKNKNKSAKEFKEFIDQGRVTIGKLGDEIQREKQAAQSSRPAGKHTWPKPGDRLNLATQKHPPSTSGRP
ncbi:hypothetical protein CF326_g9979 [Tilletia indica]|nr:hypothetical protein CF326_g9979 [Tilletia indica]